MSESTTNPSCTGADRFGLSGANAPAGKERAAGVFTPPMIVLLATWLGLVTAYLELFLFWFRWRFVNATALSSLQLNQHAMWMVPLSDAAIFLGAGVILAVVVRLTRSPWSTACSVVAICGLAVYALMLTYRGLSTLACVALAAGAGFRLGLMILSHPGASRRLILATTPVLVALTAISWARGPSGERMAGRRLPTATPAHRTSCSS